MFSPGQCKLDYWILSAAFCLWWSFWKPRRNWKSLRSHSVCVIFRECRECLPTCSRDFEPSGKEWKTCIITSMLHIGLLVSTSFISVNVFLMSLWCLCHSAAVRYYLCQWFWTKPSEAWTNKHVSPRHSFVSASVKKGSLSSWWHFIILGLSQWHHFP